MLLAGAAMFMELRAKRLRDLPKRCDSLCAACCEDGAACKTWMGKCDLCLRTTCIIHAEINVEGIFGDKRCADGTVPDVICRACAAAVEVATGTEKTGNNVAGLGITLDKKGSYTDA